MTTTTTTTTTDRRIPTLLLTTLCVLLTLNLVVTVASSSHAAPAEAQGYGGQPTPASNAQPGLNGGAFNAARAADGIAEINMRLARIEARLDKGFNVKVTEMPAITISNPAPAPASKVDADQPKP